MKKSIPKDFIILVFRGNKLKPDTITECLGIEPDTCACKGDRALSKKSNKRAKTGFWTIGMKLNMKISELLTCFTSEFKKKKRSLRTIMNMETVEEAYLELVITPALDYGIHSFLLKADDVKFWVRSVLTSFAPSGIQFFRRNLSRREKSGSQEYSVEKLFDK